MSRNLPLWLRLSFNVWQAGLEAQQVIGLRLNKLAGGGRAAGAEMNRMVSEKVDAALEVQRAVAKAALSGKCGADTVSNRGALSSKDARQPPAPQRRKTADAVASASLEKRLADLTGQWW